MHAEPSLTITIPMQLRRRSGRKPVVVPDGLPAAVTKPSRDGVLIRAIVMAILDGRQPNGMTLAEVFRIMEPSWDEQRRLAAAA